MNEYTLTEITSFKQIETLYHSGPMFRKKIDEAALWCAVELERRREEFGSRRQNDPKLSDGGAWRGSCEGGAQKEATDVGQRHERTRRVQARIAATVTRGAVRCSAWLGVSVRLGFITCCRG